MTENFDASNNLSNSSETPEFFIPPEIKVITDIEKLPAELGFIRAAELIKIAGIAGELLRQHPDCKNFAPEVSDIMTQYQMAGENIVNSIQDKDQKAKALLGHQIDRINILLLCGWDRNYIIGEIEDAATNAHQEGWDDIVTILENFKTSITQL